MVVAQNWGERPAREMAKGDVQIHQNLRDSKRKKGDGSKVKGKKAKKKKGERSPSKGFELAKGICHRFEGNQGLEGKDADDGEKGRQIGRGS